MVLLIVSHLCLTTCFVDHVINELVCLAQTRLYTDCPDITDRGVTKRSPIHYFLQLLIILLSPSAMVDKQRKKAAEMQRAASASRTSKTPSGGYRSNDSRQGGTTSVTDSGRRTQTSATKTFYIETPTNYNIPVCV